MVPKHQIGSIGFKTFGASNNFEIPRVPALEVVDFSSGQITAVSRGQNYAPSIDEF